MHVLISTFCILFLFSEEKQKSIDIDSICELLNIVLGSQYQAQVDLFVQYLKVSGIVQHPFMYMGLCTARVIQLQLMCT